MVHAVIAKREQKQDPDRRLCAKRYVLTSVELKNF